MEVLPASFRASAGKRAITGDWSDGHRRLNIPFLVEPIVLIALGRRVHGEAFGPGKYNVVKEIVVLGHALILH
jgi:hypothetical protein